MSFQLGKAKNVHSCFFKSQGVVIELLAVDSPKITNDSGLFGTIQFSALCRTVLTSGPMALRVREGQVCVRRREGAGAATYKLAEEKTIQKS